MSGRTRRAVARVATPLDYVRTWGKVRSDGPVTDRRLAALDAYESRHHADPVVALARDPRVSTGACAALAELVDRAVRPRWPFDEPVTARELAATVRRRPEAAVEVVRALLPRGVLVEGGWTRVVDASRGSDARVEATERALRCLLGPDAALLLGRRGAGGGLADLAGARFPFVLPPPLEAEFERLVRRARVRSALARTLGPLSTQGGGLKVLLHGVPGTGKSLAARVLAQRLGVPLRVAHASDVLRCWVGDTEQALADLFRVVAEEGSVLLLDEADGLLASRAESHWRRSVGAELLVLLEAFDGVLVAATNDAGAIDEAFRRRFHAWLELPAPGPAERLEIARAHVPAGVGLDPDADLAAVAAATRTGGEVRNVVQAALALAVERAGEGRVVLRADDLAAGIATLPARRDDMPVGFSTGART